MADQDWTSADALGLGLTEQAGIFLTVELWSASGNGILIARIASWQVPLADTLADKTMPLTAAEQADVAAATRLAYKFIANGRQVHITWADLTTPVGTRSGTDAMPVVLTETLTGGGTAAVAKTSADVLEAGSAEAWDLVADQEHAGCADTSALDLSESYTKTAGTGSIKEGYDDVAPCVADAHVVDASLTASDAWSVGEVDAETAPVAVYTSADASPVGIAETGTSEELASQFVTVVELELSAGVWTDVTADVLDGITVEYGIQGAGPLDRCASTGMLRMALNNSASNSAGLLGYYSPGHANCRAGFDVGNQLRWRVTTPADRTFHIGHIVTIDPVPGLARARRTLVESVDWMDEAASVTVSGIDTLVGVRADEILTQVLTSVTQQPEATDFSTGDSTFAYALDNVQDERTRLLTIFADVANSEGSYLYLRGNGTLVFESRTDRALNTTPVVELDDTMTGLTVGRSRDNVVNVVKTVVHPRRIDAAATTVLWSRNIADGEDPIMITAGATAPLILGAYGDPTNGRQRCGGTGMVTPVATTDYAMNTAVDGTGTDITADLAVTASLGGNGVRWTLTNNNAATGYVTKLQCRGQGIYDRAQVTVRTEDAVSLAQYGERVCQIDMPYQDDENAANGLGEQILNLYTASGSVPRRVEFIVDDRTPNPSTVLKADVGSRISVVESVSGIAAACFVNGYRVTQSANRLYMDWLVAPCDANTYWALGVAGQGELDQTTILGYG